MFPMSKTKIAVALAAGAMTTTVAAGPALAAEAGNDHGHGHGHFFKGRVTARTGLLVRTGPSQRFRVVGSYDKGSLIRIVCKVRGQNILGNPFWYKTPKGNFVSAKYVKNIGPIPKYCDHRHLTD
ncbi:SH3 domain-containing protein [Streptomyces sp. NPDC059740]|uniref:SH3 domain-containing protein n=1 Tax=Streptomyces sp. NPDC059740 TaxID=3346926 RepID=UPI00364B708C